MPSEPRTGDRRTERRARQPLLYTAAELLGRRPVRLRRRADKLRLAVHVTAVLALAALTAWWVLPHHAFSGPVLVVLAPGRGIHAGDLPSVLFALGAVRSAVRVRSLLRGG